MAFRQHNTNSDTLWRTGACSELLAAGVPSFVAGDDRRWLYVLLHGDDLESGWDPSWITREQAASLLALIQSHYESRTGLDLFGALEQRIRNP